MGFGSPWAWSGIPPHRVGCCVECGCVCLLVPFSDGRVALFDPGFVERRWLRSILAPGLLGLVGFASTPDVFEGHVCPVDDARRLPSRSSRSRFAARESRRGECSR